jgi:hypothetical protein
MPPGLAGAKRSTQTMFPLPLGEGQGEGDRA